MKEKFDPNNSGDIAHDERKPDHHPLPGRGIPIVSEDQLDACTSITFGRSMFRQDADDIMWIMDKLDQIAKQEFMDDPEVSSLKSDLLSMLWGKKRLRDGLWSALGIQTPPFTVHMNLSGHEIIILPPACFCGITAVSSKVRPRLLDGISKNLYRLDKLNLTEEAKKTMIMCVEAESVTTFTLYETEEAVKKLPEIERALLARAVNGTNAV